jgi:peptidyl-prolyl cis-trans isomerase SurA
MRRALAVVILAGMTLAAAPPAAVPQVIEEIVAIVNDDVITLSQYKQQFEVQAQQLRAANLPAEEYDKQYKILKSELLNAMITELLILQQAKEKNLNVSEELKTNIATLKKENNFTSDEDLRRAIQQQGISYEQWLKQYEEMLLKTMLMAQEVYRSIALDESEVVQYYKKHPEEFVVPAEYKLGAIYLAGDTRAPEALEALKKEISDKLKGGTGFAETAEALSDPPMKDAKGELGTFKEGDIDKAIREVVEKLKPGEVSAWVSAKNGWYLLRLEEKTASYQRTFDEARPDVQEKLSMEMRQKKSEEYIAALREQSYIKILKPNPLDY